MPEYVILDPELLRAATLAQQNTSDPRAAIQAVPATTALPERVVVVPRGALKPFFVADPGDSPEVVERPEA